MVISHPLIECVSLEAFWHGLAISIWSNSFSLQDSMRTSNLPCWKRFLGLHWPLNCTHELLGWGITVLGQNHAVKVIIQFRTETTICLLIFKYALHDHYSHYSIIVCTVSRNPKGSSADQPLRRRSKEQRYLVLLKMLHAIKNFSVRDQIWQSVSRRSLSFCHRVTSQEKYHRAF